MHAFVQLKAKITMLLFSFLISTQLNNLISINCNQKKKTLHLFLLQVGAEFFFMSDNVRG